MSSTTMEKLIPQSYKGIILYCIAILMFVTMDAIVKYANTTYEPLQVVWARYFFHMLLMTLLLAPKLKMDLVRTVKPKLQIFRSMLLLGATVCFFTALKYIPLA
ncbi:MAG: EamA/RhaT family transporter, partial [Pseudomonas marincola]